ncbi:Cytochrome P450 9e2 [Halotydeus destructor]|nr:Cytochrome P450 9e2 [Halotydeus destructor]
MTWLSTEALSAAGLLLGSVVIYVTYFLINKRRQEEFWKDRGVPGPEADDFLKTEGQISAIDYYIGNEKRYGKVFGQIRYSEPKLVISDLELIKQITVRDFHHFTDRVSLRDLLGKIMGQFVFHLEGEEWKRMRSLLSPTFTSGKMKKMYNMIDSCCKDAIESVKKQSLEGEVDLKRFFEKYSLDVIARCMFATSADPYNNTESKFVKSVHTLFIPNITKAKLFYVLPRWLFRLIGIEIFDSGSVQYLEHLILHVMQERQRSGVRGDDFVQLLIDASKEVDRSNDESNQAADELSSLNASKKSNAKKLLTNDEIVSQSILFIQAGHDTTSTLLGFMFYQLALNPDIQERLYEEVKSLTEVTYESINKLPYLEAVINETLRMHPPALDMNRKALVDYKLPGTDIVVPKGCRVEMPLIAVHYNEQYFANPFKFDPERFLPHNRDQLNLDAFMPFGSGPRNCVGSRFALLEAKLMATRTVLRFELFKQTRRLCV